MFDRCCYLFMLAKIRSQPLVYFAVCILDSYFCSLGEAFVMNPICSSFRHSEDLIQRLENAGLGYHIDADKTVDKLGKWRVALKL